MTEERKILIVEDNKSLNQLLQTYLRQKIGLDIIATMSMSEAKTAIEKHGKSIYLAILDLNLPDAERGEIVDYVLDKKIPAIVLTSTIDENKQKEMLDKGIIDYVVKRNANEVEYVADTAQRLYQNFERTVLVTDDTLFNRMLVKALLKKMNFNVLEAENGREAVELLSQGNKIDLVITDLNMPVMPGDEMIYKIREKFSRIRLGVIGMSGTNDGSASSKLLKAGANDFINLPFSHEEFSCRINQTIDVIESYRKLEEASNTDFLTGLYNRKFLFESGITAYNNARRNTFSLTVAMIDIDHFKKVNDTFGHEVGDRAIKHVADILLQSTRDGDIVARFGGEEFCILCINQASDQSQQIFDRIRKKIMSSPIPVSHQKEIPVTVSIGYTLALGDSLSQMINFADEALYAAKQGGRNRVVEYTG